MSDKSWRDADRRIGAGPRPSSVGFVVRRSHFGLSAARWGESVLIGAGALCVTLAAAAVRTGAIAGFDMWCVAVLGGALAGASWRLEHHRDLAAVARVLDRKLRHRGALVTAYETEERRQNGPLAVLLQGHVLHRLRTRDALHAIAPSLVLPLAVPLVGVALLALALEGTSVEETGLFLDPGDLVGEIDGLRVEALAAGEEGMLDDATVRDLNRLQRKVEDLAHALGRAADDPARLRAEIEAVDRELVDLGARTAEDPALAARLEAVRPYLDAARMGLADRAAPGDRAEGAAGAGGGETGDASLTGKGGHGTIPGSSDRGAERADPTSPETNSPDVPPSPVVGEGSEEGSIAGRWWADEYDEIVAGWVEHQRRALLERDLSAPPATKDE